LARYRYIGEILIYRQVNRNIEKKVELKYMTRPYVSLLLLAQIKIWKWSSIYTKTSGVFK